MRRLTSLFFIILLLTACTGQPSLGGSSSSMSGTWQNQNDMYFHLEPGGKLGLPGQTARSGLTWAQFGDRLFLNTLDVPGGNMRQSVLTITDSGPGGVDLVSQDGEASHWDKQRNIVGTFKGAASYDKSISLPADVIVRAQLFITGQEGPMATSLTLVNDPATLDFTIHYLKSDAPDSAHYQLTVSVFHDTECLLSLPYPISVSLTATPHVRLEPAAPGYNAPRDVAPPMQYQGSYHSSNGQTTVSLFLESDGLYLLDIDSNQPRVQSGMTVGNWQQIARNYTLQLGRGSQEPLMASISPSGSLLFAHPDLPGGEVELYPAALPFNSDVFVLKGNYNPADNTFTDCASGIIFPVRGGGGGLDQAKQAHARSGQSQSTPVLLRCEVKLSPQSGAGSSRTNAHQLELVRVREILHGETCDVPYASVSLENTYWRLVSLNSEPISITPELSEPHLILRPGDEAVGSDGCNNYFMPWSNGAESIDFGEGASTLMICESGMALAQAMKTALQNAQNWKITGRVLDLSAGGTSLATFEAVEL